jgi:hypothetical protein
VKKLLILAMLVALGFVAAKRLRGSLRPRDGGIVPRLSGESSWTVSGCGGPPDLGCSATPAWPRHTASAAPVTARLAVGTGWGQGRGHAAGPAG